jgi:hypothetical protein
MRGIPSDLADNDAEGLRLLDLLGASGFDRLAFLARLRPDDAS